jgi:hypothetical protein
MICCVRRSLSTDIHICLYVRSRRHAWMNRQTDAARGKRAELIKILKESRGDMPGCPSYVVAKDSAEENSLWVTGRSRCLLIVTSGEECSASSQSDRFSRRSRSQVQFRESGWNSAGSLSCGRITRFRSNEQFGVHFGTGTIRDCAVVCFRVSGH